VATVLSLVLVSENILASGSGDKTIRIWDLTAFNTIKILKGN
jgi:WD40 repeat protein